MELKRKEDLLNMRRRKTDGGIVYWFDKFVNGRLSSVIDWLLKAGAIGVAITLLYDNLVYQKKIADTVVVNKVHIEATAQATASLQKELEGNTKEVIELKLCAAGMKKDVSHLRRDVDKLMKPRLNAAHFLPGRDPL